MLCTVTLYHVTSQRNTLTYNVHYRDTNSISGSQEEIWTHGKSLWIQLLFNNTVSQLQIHYYIYFLFYASGSSLCAFIVIKTLFWISVCMNVYFFLPSPEYHSQLLLRLHWCIWQMLYSKVTCVAFKEQIWSVHAFHRNRTRDLGVACAMLQNRGKDLKTYIIQRT